MLKGHDKKIFLICAGSGKKPTKAIRKWLIIRKNKREYVLSERIRDYNEKVFCYRKDKYSLLRRNAAGDKIHLSDLQHLR